MASESSAAKAFRCTYLLKVRLPIQIEKCDELAIRLKTANREGSAAYELGNGLHALARSAREAVSSSGLPLEDLEAISKSLDDALMDLTARKH